jgi:D-beta-D-heptose 7-phosphate kinase/D-beta-D-heptose 1-phosphate adenosyltransferase
MITVVGDVMVDQYIYGSSTRMSPECTSAPVVKEFATKYCLGGAGNTALNIKHLGHVVRVVASFSKDSKIRQLLGTEEIPFSDVPNENQDVIKTRVYSNGEYIARLDYDYPVKCNYSKLVQAVFDRSPDMIVLSDYNKGTVVDPREIIKKANSLGLAVLVDPKKDLELYSGAFVLKPNLKEFLEWAEISAEELNRDMLVQTAQDLGVQNLVITMGEQGVLLATADGIYGRFDAYKVKAIDPTGAGDSFLAGLAVAINEGKGIRKAIDFATKVAGIAVTKRGTSYVKRNEI